MMSAYRSDVRWRDKFFSHNDRALTMKVFYQNKNRQVKKLFSFNAMLYLVFSFSFFEGEEKKY